MGRSVLTHMDWKLNFKRPSTQRWQCPIYNGTLKRFVWSNKQGLIHFVSTYSVNVTGSVITSDPRSKDVNGRFTTVPSKDLSDQVWYISPFSIYFCNQLLIYICGFYGSDLRISCITEEMKKMIVINTFQKNLRFWSDKGFKGIVVITLSGPLMEGRFKIMSTVL